MTLTADQSRALTMLADARHRGVPDALLIEVHDFTIELLAGLVRAGYANVSPESVSAAGRNKTVLRMRITDTGREALARRTGSAKG